MSPGVSVVGDEPFGRPKFDGGGEKVVHIMSMSCGVRICFTDSLPVGRLLVPIDDSLLAKKDFSHRSPAQFRSEVTRLIELRPLRGGL